LAGILTATTGIILFDLVISTSPLFKRLLARYERVIQ
jgi:hypothetical protein